MIGDLTSARPPADGTIVRRVRESRPEETCSSPSQDLHDPRDDEQRRLRRTALAAGRAA